MEFRILGPLDIVDGERRLSLGGPKRRAVVALLLRDANRVVAAERLIDGVWGEEPPAGAAVSLQNHVLRLRRELGDRIVTRSPGYLVRVEPDELDLDRFRRLVEAARAAEPAEAAALLRKALALWRGPPLADLAGEPAAAAAAGLGELRLEAVERRVDADLALGRHAELVAELESLVAEEPYRERLRAQLLLALYRAGRQTDALNAYAAARATLVADVGAEPGAELRALHHAILRHDPTLDAPASPSPATEPAERVEETRKTVTLVLADLRVDARADPETRRDELRRAHDAAAAAIEARGGTVGRTAEDRVLGIFGVPAAREDDALRAVAAACELRADGVTTRAVVSTGDVITGDPSRGQPLVSGPPLDEADRLRTAAAGGDVLAGQRSWRLVRHAVAGRERDGTFAVERVLEGAEPLVRRFETPFVGRADELDELLEAFRRVERERRARLVTVFGSPGVGKTRLARELVEAMSGSATCLVGRAPAFGEDRPYAPLRDAFAKAAGSDGIAGWAARVVGREKDGELLATRVAAAAGEGSSAAPVEETAWAVRRFLETLARARPLALVLEDLHAASRAFLDLVEHVVGFARAPILVVGLARPELLDARPAWGGGGLNASSLLLDPLPPDRAGELLDRLASETTFDEEARGAILAAAAGNPLFLEQLLASVVEDGQAALPDSIHVLLAARFDTLGRDELRVSEAAATLGQAFPVDIVDSLVEDVDVRPALVTLARREFVSPDGPGALGEETWRFRHALLRDEAYARIPKRRRASLHERIAEIASANAAAQMMDADEFVGYHLESAYLARREVDPDGEGSARLAADAARRLTSAGLRAYEERNAPSAARLLRRAAALRPPGSRERVAAAPYLVAALTWIDDRDGALEVLAEAEQAVRPGDEPMRARLLVVRHSMRLAGRDAHDPAHVLADARAAIVALEAAGDDEGLAWAYLLAFEASQRSAGTTTADQPDAIGALRLALVHARAAGARATEGLATSWICIVVRRGTWPVETAEREVLAILEDPPTRHARASALGALGTLRAMRGDFEEGRALAAEGHAIIEDLGIPQTAAADLIALADVEILAGDLAAAEALLRDALKRLDGYGDAFGAVNAAWRLAFVLARGGRSREAQALLDRTADVDAGEVVRAWRRVLGATLAARRGEESVAVALLEETDRSLDRHSESGMHADLLVQAAEATTALGRAADAVSRLRLAAEIAGRLGYVVAERAARERLAELDATAAAT